MKKIKLIPIKNKKGFEFKMAFFAVIVMSMMIIALDTWITEWSSEYSSGISSDLSEYNKLESVSADVAKQQGNISVTSSVQGEDFEGTSIRATFGILNNIYAPFRVVFGNGGWIDSLTDRFGIPDYVRRGIVTMMIVAITFTLIAIFFRREKA